MRSLLFFAVLVSTSQCGPGSYGRCEEGYSAQGGNCVPSMDGGLPDGALDDAPSGDAGPCGRVCPDDQPMCDTTTGDCVQCMEDRDCDDPEASQCLGGSCVRCDGDDDCMHIEGATVCGGGTCVECSDTNATACGANPCTRANTCSDYGPRQRPCERCDTDSNCTDDHYCVPMMWNGDPREGGYCLKNGMAIGGCQRPFTIPLPGRTSLSGEAGQTYCGINEAATTCEAVRALLDDVPCPGGNECPEGGACRMVGLTLNRCTYVCTGPAQCDESPNPGSTCGGSPTSYCGN